MGQSGFTHHFQLDHSADHSLMESPLLLATPHLLRAPLDSPPTATNTRKKTIRKNRLKNQMLHFIFLSLPEVARDKIGRNRHF